MTRILQETYALVIWSNGVSSIHLNEAEARDHISRMRGEIDSWGLRHRSSDRVKFWKKSTAHVLLVTVTHTEKVDAL